MNRRVLIAAILLGVVSSAALVRSSLTREAPTVVQPIDTEAAAPPSVESGGQSPVLAQKARLDRRRMLYETVDGLLQVGEFERARRLLDEDRERYGSDSKAWLELAQGYRLLADCLQYPDARFQGHAEAFLRTSQVRTLDFELRAACLEPRD